MRTKERVQESFEVSKERGSENLEYNLEEMKGLKPDFYDGFGL
jgi:hypothetical protein